MTKGELILRAHVEQGRPSFPYAAEAERTTIRYVIDTHLHADQVSAGRALAEVAGAAHALHESAAAILPFQPARDGDTLALGSGDAFVVVEQSSGDIRADVGS